MSRFASFREFYPFYLGEHSNPTCRRLHFVGSWVALLFGFVLWPAVLVWAYVDLPARSKAVAR